MTAIARRSWQGGLIDAARQSAVVAGRGVLACVLEVTAPKPGNVSPDRPFADMRYEDFVASADAIARPLESAGRRPLGDTILEAVTATSERTRANTNLGIVLLFAPLARAAIRRLDLPVPAERDERLQRLRADVRQVLRETTIDDARHVYRAIRLANPGGLGSAEEQDVAAEPTVTLLEAMRLAADRDGVAREYATSFETTFETGVPALLNARADGVPLIDAIVESYLTIVAARPDTHIVRRGGEQLARRASDLAAETLAAGGVRSDAGRRAVEAMDAALRDSRNLGNPGTSADLMAASLFAALVVGGWPLGTLPGIDVHRVGLYSDSEES
jgi:triphosphoribosyl-dephospho-CoA synthase